MLNFHMQLGTTIYVNHCVGCNLFFFFFQKFCPNVQLPIDNSQSLEKFPTFGDED